MYLFFSLLIVFLRIFINRCQSTVAPFLSYDSLFNFSLKAHGTVRDLVVVVVEVRVWWEKLVFN